MCFAFQADVKVVAVFHQFRDAGIYRQRVVRRTDVNLSCAVSAFFVIEFRQSAFQIDVAHMVVHKSFHREFRQSAFQIDVAHMVVHKSFHRDRLFDG